MVDVSEAVSAELLLKAKDRLKELHDAWGKTEVGVTLGRVMTLKGEETHGVAYNMCHAWLTRAFSSNRATKKNFLLLSCHSKNRSKGICSPEAHEAIILWMASDECPFSKYILNRDDKDSLLNGGIIVYCGPDGVDNDNHAMWMCKVLRYGIEGSNALDVWYELYKSGVNPLLALYVCTYVRTVRGATFGWTGAEGHSAVFRGAYWGAYKGGAVAKDLLIGKVNDKATNTTEVFASLKKTEQEAKVFVEKENALIAKFCKPIKKSDGWGGEVDGNAASKEEFIKGVLEWQAKLEKELEGGLVAKVVAAVKKPKAPDKSTVFLEVDL